MTFTKLPALTAEQAGLRSGCLTCGPQPITLHMDAVIAVGFGDARVTRDGELVWSEHRNCDPALEWADIWTTRQAEEAAAADPDHDWRINFEGPLSNAAYQRHAPEQWVLVEKGMGFA